jgi:hypothetical protein
VSSASRRKGQTVICNATCQPGGERARPSARRYTAARFSDDPIDAQSARQVVVAVAELALGTSGDGYGSSGVKDPCGPQGSGSEWRAPRGWGWRARG